MYNIGNIFLTWEIMTLNSLGNTPENQKQKKVDLNQESQKNFVEFYLEQNIDFFENLNDAEILDKYEKFINSKKDYKELWINISKYTADQKDKLVEQIKNQKINSIFVRKKNLKDLEEVFVWEYNNIKITELRAEISKLSILDLLKLMRSEWERREFLKNKKIFSEEDILKEKKLQEEKIFDKIKISKDNFYKLSIEQKQKLSDIFVNYKKLELNDIDDILAVLEDSDSKQNLLKYFVTKISVEDLKDRKLFSSKMEKIFIESIKKELWVDEPKAKIIFNELDKSEIFLNTNDLDSAWLEALVWDQNFKSRIIEAYNSWIDEVFEKEENFLWSLNIDKNGNVNDSFIDFVRNNPKISDKVKEKILFLQDWNYLEVWWSFYYIKKVDNWDNLITKNIVLEDITSSNWVKKVGKWVEKSYTYQNFLELLKRVSVKENNLSFDIKTKENFKQKEDLTEISNYDELLKWLNNLDPEWEKYWLSEEKTTIVDTKSDFIFLIKKIDKKNNQIIVSQWWVFWDKKMSFTEFYSSIKGSDKTYKRWQKVNSFWELKNFLSSNSAFWNLDLKWNNIIDKIKDKDWKNPIKYFTWWGKWIYIKNISDDKIEYFIWSIKDWKEWKVFKSDSKVWNFSQFLHDINKNSFSPDFEWKVSQSNGNKPKMRYGFWKKFFSWLSISEILNSAEFMVKWVQKKLEKWNRLKSLKFAQKFWWLLWKDMKLTLQAMAEAEEKSLIDEISNDLKKLDSGPMIEQIKEIMTNKHSEQYELIACLMTLASKTGQIYPKALSAYAWSLHWYRLLWWTDEFLEKYKKSLTWKNEANWKIESKNFTEEWLVEEWLMDLWKKWKVRSKLWKDFASAIATWRNEQLTDWENKAGDQNSFDWRMKLFIDWLSSREFANAIWAMWKVFWKESSPEEMHAAPFVLAMSWLWKELDQVLVKKIQTHALTSPYVSLMFAYTEAGNVKYKNFIEALIKNAYKDDKNMMKEFLAIKNSKDVRKIYKFWWNYSSKLVKYLNFKDSYVALNAEKIPEFKDFVDTAKETWSDPDFVMSDENIWVWIYDKNNIAISGKWLDSSKFYMAQNWWPGWRSWEKILWMYLDYFKSLKNSTGSEEDKKKLFKEVYTKFDKHITNIIWTWRDKVDKAPIAIAIREAGLEVSLGYKDDNYDAFLEKTYMDFKNFSWRVSKAEKDTRFSIDDIINWKTK